MVLNPSRYSNTLSSLKKYVRVKNGMLAFNDEESFKYVVEFLFNAVEVASRYNLDLGYLDEYDYVLEQFESTFGHNSLRRSIATQVRVLFTTNRLSDKNDIRDYYIPDKLLQSFVNINYDLIIAGRVINLKEVQRQYFELQQSRNNRLGNTKYPVTDTPKGIIQAGADAITLTSVSGSPLSGNPLSYNIYAHYIAQGDCAVGNLVFDWTIKENKPGAIPDNFQTTYNPITYPFNGYSSYNVCVKVSNTIAGCESEEKCADIDVKEYTPSSCCRAFDSHPESIYTPNGEYKMKTNFVLLSLGVFIPFYNSITATTYGYKRIAGNYLAKIMYRMDIDIEGDYHELYCNGATKTAAPAIKTRYNRLQIIKMIYSGVPIWIKNDDMISHHWMMGHNNYPYLENVTKLAYCP